MFVILLDLFLVEKKNYKLFVKSRVTDNLLTRIQHLPAELYVIFIAHLTACNRKGNYYIIYISCDIRRYLHYFI